MAEDWVIKVDHVSKKFCKRLKKSMIYGVTDIVRELTFCESRELVLRKDEFLAVNDISFELRRGECIGLIGPNGCGKSTLLKLINGLISPDAGRIETRGKVGALIELTAGFNPILTGRENIYINAAVLGLDKRFVDERIDSIIEFSEIGEFMDMPVQNYSSGMKVRLGFAVAAHMEPDILLIDEVLAVGDAGFRAKCYNAISQMCENAAVIFVSHAMPHVMRICNRALLMKNGTEVYLGDDLPHAIDQYEKLFDNAQKNIMEEENCRITKYECNGTAEEKIEIEYKKSLRVEIEAEIDTKFEELDYSVFFVGQSREYIAACDSRSQNIVIENKTGKIKVDINMDDLNISPGKYFLSVFIRKANTNMILCWHSCTKSLSVQSSFSSFANISYFGNWDITNK